MLPGLWTWGADTATTKAVPRGGARTPWVQGPLGRGRTGEGDSQAKEGPSRHRNGKCGALRQKAFLPEAYECRGAAGARALEHRHELQSVNKRTHLFSVCFPSNPPPYSNEYHLLNTFNSVGKNT